MMNAATQPINTVDADTFFKSRHCYRCGSELSAGTPLRASGNFPYLIGECADGAACEERCAASRARAGEERKAEGAKQAAHDAARRRRETAEVEHRREVKRRGRYIIRQYRHVDPQTTLYDEERVSSLKEVREALAWAGVAPWDRSVNVWDALDGRWIEHGYGGPWQPVKE